MRMETSEAAPAEMERPLPRSVLFVSGVESAPVRYRVTNLLEQLSLLRVPATARHYHDEEAISLVAGHEVVIFQRVPWDGYVERLIARARSAGALPVFGIDDLLFDPSRLPPLVSAVDRPEAEAWRHAVQSFRRVFDACDAFLGTTETLARAAAELGKTAFVHRNSLSRELIELSEAARRRKQESRGFCIGYFSGTRTHARDFVQVAGALSKVMSARPEARLLLVGPLQVPRELEGFRARIERLPVVPWRKLPELLARADVNLAPLELDERFCHAKSELKWFEAAAAGVTTIASPTEPFQLAIRDGETGFLARSPQQWEERIIQLIDEPALRQRVAEASRREALSNHGPEASARSLEAALRRMNALRPQLGLGEVGRVSPVEIAALKAAGLGIGKAAIEPADAIAGPDQLATRLQTPPLNGALAARQIFRSVPGRLYRIDVMVSSFRRINNHQIELRLVDARTQARLAHATADASDACDNAWFAFEFEPVEITGERELELTVEATLAPPGQGLSLWYEPSPEGKGSCGDLGPLDLAYRTWLRPAGWRAAPRATSDEQETQALELRLKRAEEQSAAVRVELLAVRQRLLELDDAVRLLSRLRGTLIFRIARRIYRFLRS